MTQYFLMCDAVSRFIYCLVWSIPLQYLSTYCTIHWGTISIFPMHLIFAHPLTSSWGYIDFSVHIFVFHTFIGQSGLCPSASCWTSYRPLVTALSHKPTIVWADKLPHISMWFPSQLLASHWSISHVWHSMSNTSWYREISRYLAAAGLVPVPVPLKITKCYWYWYRYRSKFQNWYWYRPKICYRNTLQWSN